MFDRFSDEAVKVIMLAIEEAKILDHEEVGSEHLLLGLFLVGSSATSHEVLNSYSFDLGKTRREVENLRIRKPGSSGKELPFSNDAKQVIQAAYDAARTRFPVKIESGHMLLGIVQTQNTVAVGLLTGMGVDLQELRMTIIYRIPQAQEPNIGDCDNISDGYAKESLSGCFEVMKIAAVEGARLGHASIGTELILLGLAGAGGSVANALCSVGVTPDSVRTAIENIVGIMPSLVVSAKEVPLSLRARRLVKDAMDVAFQHGHDKINPRHLLLAILQESDCVAYVVVKRLKVNIEDLRSAGLKLLQDS